MNKDNRDLEKEQGFDGGKEEPVLRPCLNKQQTSIDGKKYYAVFIDKMGKKYYLDPNQRRLDYLRRRITAWCNLAKKWEEMGAKLWMITLTYKPGKEQQTGDINIFMRKILRRKGIITFAYAWVGELQKRGAVHFHILVYAKGRIPKPDKCRMWCNGRTGVEIARTPFYLLVHTGKEYQKDFDRFPKGMRAFGVWIKDKKDKEELKLSIVSPDEEDLIKNLGTEKARKVSDMIKEMRGMRYLYSGWIDLSMVKAAKKNESGELPAQQISV